MAETVQPRRQSGHATKLAILLHSPSMMTVICRRRRPRGVNTRRSKLQQASGRKGFTLPEYLDQSDYWLKRKLAFAGN